MNRAVLSLAHFITDIMLGLGVMCAIAMIDVFFQKDLSKSV